ncbi:MAG: hypothetical protein ACYC26_05420 [Phycisphaerales bacterium]
MPKFLVLVGCVCAALWCAGTPVSAEDAPVPAPEAGKVVPPVARPRMGMNLNGPSDWNSELPFVDVFRMSRSWVGQKKGEKWGRGPALELDSHGWVKKIDPDCWATTLMCTISGGHYPSGRYTVLHEGEGQLTFSRNVKVIDESQPGRLVIEVDATGGAVFMNIVKTNPDNYIRNIRVIMPGFEDTYQTEPFHPAFLKRWQGVACFRFMDWMGTNNSKIVRWEDRPTLAHATFARSGGVPLEVMIDLCNRQKADAWFCMPHLADDEYVRQFAAMVRQKLDPSLKVYVEYSNEAWNNMFQQARDAQKKAVELGLGEPKRPWEGGCMYYTRRSLEIFKIWEEVFEGKDRLVRVIAWQAASDARYWLDGMLLSGVKPGQVDALAIAPYLSFNIPGTSKNPDALTSDKVGQWTVDQVMDHVEQTSLPQSVQWITRAKGVADKYGLKLIAYEAGQHLVGVGGGENNEAMTKLFHQANAHRRMGECYTKYFQAWQDAGGDLMAIFASVGGWGKWGSWGLLQYAEDDATEQTATPKFMATMRWAASLGQPVNVPPSAPAAPVSPAPPAPVQN